MVILLWHELSEGKYYWHIKHFSLDAENRAEKCANSHHGNERLIPIMEVKICTWPISTLLGGEGGGDGDHYWDINL